MCVNVCVNSMIREIRQTIEKLDRLKYQVLKGFLNHREVEGRS